MMVCVKSFATLEKLFSQSVAYFADLFVQASKVTIE